MFSLLLCNIYLHKWKDPAPEAQANSTIWGPPLRQAHWVLPRQLSSFQVQDETLADSSLLNKAPSKGGGGGEGTKRDGPSSSQKYRSQSGSPQGKGTNQSGICFGRRQKNALPRDWKPDSQLGLPFFLWKLNSRFPPTHQPLALRFHFWNSAKW